MSGIWRLVEKKSGTGASGSISFSGLDGDLHKWYKIIGQGASDDASSTAHDIEWNGAATSTTSRTWWGSGASWLLDTTVNHYYDAAAVDDVIALEALIFADSTDTTERIIRTMATKNSTDTGGAVYFGAHSFTDTSTNITSLELNVSAGNWTTDSVFRLYRLVNP